MGGTCAFQALLQLVHLLPETLEPRPLFLLEALFLRLDEVGGAYAAVPALPSRLLPLEEACLSLLYVSQFFVVSSNQLRIGPLLAFEREKFLLARPLLASELLELGEQLLELLRVIILTAN